MKRKRSRVRRVIGFLILMPALLFLFLQTPPGKTLLADTLSKALSGSDHLDVRVSGISGWIPVKVSIESLEVGDATGTWLRLRDVSCGWSIRDLFKERVTFQRLSAEEIDWSRFPKVGERTRPRKESRGEFKPVEVRLEGLNVKRLKVGKGVAGLDLEYAVSSGGVVYRVDGELEGELAVRGDADGLVRLEASITGAAKDYFKMDADLRSLNRPLFGLDALAGNGEATINASGVSALITADLTKNGWRGRVATRLDYAKRQLSLQQFQFTAPDFSLAGDLTLGFQKGAIDVALESSFVDVQTNQYDVRGVAVVATSNKTWGVDVESLEIRGWEVLALDVAGHMSSDEVALNGRLREFDVGAFPLGGASNFTGAVNGELAITGSLKRPEISAGVVVKKLASSSAALDELPELDFMINGGVTNGTLFGSTAITNHASGRFSAAFDMPCAFSLAPFTFKPAPRGVSGVVEGDLDLAVFNQLAFLQNQLIQGVLKTNVKYVDGAPSGFLNVENGRYEHYDLGVVFHDFNARLVATPDGFVVKHGSATDGGDGAVKMTGGLSEKGLGLRFDFARAQIIRRDEADASMSGWLGVTGGLARPNIAGELTIDRAEILLDNIAPAPPPLLTNYDATKTNRVDSVARKKRKAPPVGLDVKILMPAQVFVIASMIETTLEGELRVKDTPKGVSVSGRVEPRRGFVNFIGKKFRFTEGDMLLDGSIPTMAVLNNVTAEYARRDVTARLVLTGPANNPRFRLESTPPLPEDEVLSHVLFNRDTSSISPYQAYQIAMAARQLSGGMNGPGFMYQVRQAIGVDTLEWREADAAGESSSVAAGKYIASGLYVEVNRELDSRGQTGMMAEFELTRHFSVETYTGPKLRPGIGVNWRNDY